MTLRAKISALRLVYPPISNQEAAWLLKVPEVEAIMRRSDLYMIAGREELHFDVFNADPETGVVDLGIALTTGLTDTGRIAMRELPGVVDEPPGIIALNAGPKFLKVTADGASDRDEPLEWFTTEKLLFDRWRRRSGLSGFDRYRDFATYELLYVGIAREGDSFDRVVKGGHEKRLAILTNELQRFATSRVSDEVYLFLFAVEPLFITTYDLDHDFTDHDFDAMPIPAKTVLADAEKAFVKLMDPKYNDVKFKGYPKGKQGLGSAGLERYAYLIGEDLTFRTPAGRIRGGFDPGVGWSNEADAIMIEGGDLVFWDASKLIAPAGDAGATP